MSAAEKELDGRRRACLDGAVTHLRCDEWFGDVLEESPITYLGTPADLHGPVCTCCPRRVA